MGSSYFGEPNMGNNERGGGSSRKGKKINSDKPKQPQRGLGVAQLEKIRLHGQIGSTDYQYPSLLTPPYPPTNCNQKDMRMQTVPSSSFSNYSSSSPSSASYAFHPNTMMGLSEHERTNIRYRDSQPTITASWDPSHGISETQHFSQRSPIRHLVNPHVDVNGYESKNKSKKHRSNSIESNSQNSISNDTPEVDLELRLSL